MENFNPFRKEDENVSEPRIVEAEKTVSELNEKPLNQLLKKFEDLKKGQAPRRIKGAYAHFILSSQPGYGKSHLIGRLFRSLSEQAVLVYIRPFGSTSSYWQSVLMNMINELRFPDKIGIEYGNKKEPSQLEMFAYGIIRSLLVSAIENRMISVKDEKKTLELFYICSLEKFRSSQNRVQWVRNNIKKLSACLQSIVNLSESAQSWLSILFEYAYFPESELRIACLDWLKGGSIDPDEAKNIGIGLRTVNADHDTNELCKHRLLDFCQLAGFFRPFVFCFDQTENYGENQNLAKIFGLVIQVLADEAYNHLTVVTANQHVWQKSVAPYWEEAYKSRLGPPIRLEGLNRIQADELIERRFGKDNADKKAEFIGDKQWLKQLYEDRYEIGVREFLQECRDRWQTMFENGVVEKPLLSDVYKQYLNRIDKSQPKRFVFDPDTFRWFVKDAAANLPETQVKEYKSEKGYFTLLWKLKDREILFGFEAGSNWARWQAITREAQKYYDAKRQKVKAVLFRTPELQKLPVARWKIAPVMEKAGQQYLHIFCLERQQLMMLYAAYDLYLNAVSEDIPFQKQDVLRFISEEFGWFWETIQQPIAIKKEAGFSKPDGIKKELIEEICSIVQREKFLNMDEAMKKLSESVSAELFREACGCIPQIRVHDSPTVKVLQWQSNQ